MSIITKDFFTSMVGRMFAPQPAPVVEKRMQNLEQKLMNIRAAGVRERFQVMLARNEEMAQRVEAFKKQRNNETQEVPLSIDPIDEMETIVLAS